MKTLISLFFLLLAGSSLFGQTIQDAKFVVGAGSSGGMLLVEVDSSQLVSEIFIEIGSNSGTNDRLDMIYYASPNEGQSGFRLINENKILLSLPVFPGPAPHHFRLRLENATGEISSAYTFTHSL